MHLPCELFIYAFWDMSGYIFYLSSIVSHANLGYYRQQMPTTG